MNFFFEAQEPLQMLLLVLSQITVITLAGSCILVFHRRYGSIRLLGAAAALLLNTALYVLMQLDSHIGLDEPPLRLPMPCWVLLPVTVLSLGYGIWAILRETRNRKTMNNNSIQEAFDNLPAGVCFFNEAGLPVLCNRAMHRFSFAVAGKDVQFVTDLEDCFTGEVFVSPGVKKEGKVFVFSDGQAWRLEKRNFLYEDGMPYTQYIATDVTELNKKRMELQQDTASLRRVRAELKKLSANVVAITREEEVLNAKMRVHDEMGRCLVAAQKYLWQDSEESIPDSVVQSWQRAVSTLKYNNDTADEDMLSQIRKACSSLKVGFIQTGGLPGQERTAYLLTCAVRECVTNAVRHGEASELYAVFSETASTAAVTVTNNGKQPQGEISEGGGLSTLRRRVEREGGTMIVQSLPRFQLTVTVPKGEEVFR